MCSIKSQLTTSDAWLSRVSRINVAAFLFQIFPVRIASNQHFLADEDLEGACTHFTISSSAIRATDILDAWYENDPALLVQELAKSSAPEATPCDDFCERERLDLLAGIAAQMATSIASGEDARVYIGLLQHLATPGIFRNEYWTC